MENERSLQLSKVKWLEFNHFQKEWHFYKKLLKKSQLAMRKINVCIASPSVKNIELQIKKHT